MELKPEELEAKNTADQQWIAGINSSYISCRGSFIGLKHTTIAKMFRRCEECIELRSAVIARAAEIARLTADVEFWKSAAEAQRRKNCDECVRIAEGKMVAKLQARVAELEAMLHDIIDSIPSTYDEEDPTVKRHAAALNVAWNSLKEVGHDG